jgi:CubicO group peptidase (beta-lactamase class C family)
MFVAKIAAQEPNWPVGTEETYHSVTFGFIVGEIVRRIDGRSIDRFAEELASPCDAEFILGRSDDDLRRVVTHIPNPANDLMNGGLINEGREGNVGTAGAGGFCAFADPANRISFGYTPNRYTTGAGMGEEPRRLIDALYASL